METDLLSPVKGQFPFHYTHDERFQYRVKVQPVADRLEFSIRCADTRLAALAARREWEGYPVRGKTTSVAKDPDDSKRRAKLRAKGMVRLLALQLRIDRMFTFTIRKDGDCMEYDLVLKAWDIFRRSMEKAYPDFRYIATPEKQKSGQWHIHAGTRGFMNINVLRRCWHAALNRVLGRSLMLTSGKDSPGHVHIGNKGPILGSQCRKSGRIAGYIAKYIGKAMDLAFNRKKYFHSYGVVITPAQRQWLEAGDVQSALVEVLDKYGVLSSLSDHKCHIPSVWFRDNNSAWFFIDIEALPPPF